MSPLLSTFPTSKHAQLFFHARCCPEVSGDQEFCFDAACVIVAPRWSPSISSIRCLISREWSLGDAASEGGEARRCCRVCVRVSRWSTDPAEESRKHTLHHGQGGSSYCPKLSRLRARFAVVRFHQHAGFSHPGRVH